MFVKYCVLCADVCCSLWCLSSIGVRYLLLRCLFLLCALCSGCSLLRGDCCLFVVVYLLLFVVCCLLFVTVCCVLFVDGCCRSLFGFCC